MLRLREKGFSIGLRFECTNIPNLDYNHIIRFCQKCMLGLCQQPEFRRNASLGRTDNHRDIPEFRRNGTSRSRSFRCVSLIYQYVVPMGLAPASSLVIYLNCRPDGTRTCFNPCYLPELSSRWDFVNSLNYVK